MKKKAVIITILAALTLLFSSCVMDMFLDQLPVNTDFRYDIIEDKKCYVYEYNGESPYITIPRFRKSDRVVAVAGKWRMGIDWQNDYCKIKGVTMLDNITLIGRNAFYDCWDLEKVVIPDSVTEISYHAFENCEKLPEITIPDSVKYVRSSAFERCDLLKTVKWSRNAKEIPSDCFTECFALESFDFTGVEKIYDRAFKGCSSLSKVMIPNTVTHVGLFAFDDLAPDAQIYIEKGTDRSGWEGQWTNVKSANIHYDCDFSKMEP